MSEGTEASVGSKRRSRFSSLDNAPDSQKDQNSAASLREQEDLIIQKELEESQNNAKKQRTISMKDTIDLAFSHPSAQDAIQAAAARAAEISKELNSKIALVSSILMHNSAPTSNSERKAAYRPLLLDKLGQYKLYTHIILTYLHTYISYIHIIYVIHIHKYIYIRTTIEIIPLSSWIVYMLYDYSYICTHVLCIVDDIHLYECICARQST